MIALKKHTIFLICLTISFNLSDMTQTLTIREEENLTEMKTEG